MNGISCMDCKIASRSMHCGKPVPCNYVLVLCLWLNILCTHLLGRLIIMAVFVIVRYAHTCTHTHTQHSHTLTLTHSCTHSHTLTVENENVPLSMSLLFDLAQACIEMMYELHDFYQEVTIYNLTLSYVCVCFIATFLG